MDAQLLAQIYLELKGGKQPPLFGDRECFQEETPQEEHSLKQKKKQRAYRQWPLAPEEERAHGALLAFVEAPPWC